MLKIKNHVGYRIWVWAMFIILPIAYVWVFARFHQVMSSGDFMFQANRMEELYQDVIHGTLIPRISSYTFNQVGSGINFFYPWVLLYPFVFLRIIFHNPVVAFYLFVLLYTYLTIVIAYFCMKSYSESDLISYVFALLYTFSNYHFYLVWNQNVLAEAIAYTFLPLVFLGFYETFFHNYNKWPLLAIGMALLLLSHMLTTFLAAVVMLIIFVVSVPAIKEFFPRFKSAIKAAVLCIFLSAFYLFPFLEQEIKNNVRGSWLGLLFVQTPFDTIKNAVNNMPNQNIGLLLILSMVFGVLYIRKASYSDKAAYLSGLILVVLTTTLIPWSNLSSTPLAIMQFPYRLNGLATFMLSVYLSWIIAKWISKLQNDPYKLSWALVMSVLIIFGLDINASLQITNTRQFAPQMSTKQTMHNYLPDKTKTFNLTSDDWHNMFYYFGHNGSFDYFPRNLNGTVKKDVVTHHAWINGRKINVSSRIKKSPNQISYNLKGLKSGAKITLPVIYYANDVVKDGKENIKKPKVDRHNLIQVKVPKNNKVVTVKYKDSLVDSISLLVSILSWLGLILVSFMRKYNLRRKV